MKHYKSEKEYNFEKSVIASGAFSKNLTDQLGEKIPLRYRKRIPCTF